MAKFYLDDYVVNNSFKDVVAVSWEVALDRDYLIIVDETIYNTTDILVWSSPLTKIDGTGHYDSTTPLYIRVKIYTTNNGKVDESDWFYVGSEQDFDRVIKLTDKDGFPIGAIQYTFDGFERIW